MNVLVAQTTHPPVRLVLCFYPSVISSDKRKARRLATGNMEMKKMSWGIKGNEYGIHVYGHQTKPSLHNNNMEENEGWGNAADTIMHLM